MTKEEHLMKLMGEISDEYIDEAHASISFNTASEKNNKYIIWKSVAALTACICILTVCIPMLKHSQSSSPEKNSLSPTEELTTAAPCIDSYSQLNYIPQLLYNNCSYEIFETPVSTAILKLINYSSSDDFFISKGVCTQITENMLGSRLCYLSIDNNQHFIQSASETEIELFEYSPAPCSGVYIINNDNTYMYAFINQTDISSDIQTTFAYITDIFEIYGINDSNNIEAIYFTDDNHSEIFKPITASDCILQFYTHLNSLGPQASKDFFSELYQGLSTEEIESVTGNIDQLYTDICIQSTTGLRFTIKYLSDYGWLYSNISNEYYKVPDDMKAWFDRYIMK